MPAAPSIRVPRPASPPAALPKSDSSRTDASHPDLARLRPVRRLRDLAFAALDPALVKPLGGDDADARVEAITKLGALASPEAFALLNALNDEKLYVTTEGRVLVVEDDKATDPLTGEKLDLPEGAESVTINNRLRRELESALAGLRLFSDDPKVRLKAAQEVQQNAGAAQLPLLEQALAKETDARIRDVLDMAVATINLKSDDAGQAQAGRRDARRHDQRLDPSGARGDDRARGPTARSPNRTPACAPPWPRRSRASTGIC